MKPTRFLWIFMVALLVPAMALSGCDKKKHVNRDDDDDGSSSGSKESTEKVEKKESRGGKNSKDESNDISGRYEYDQENIAKAFGSKDFSDYDVVCYFDFDDNDILNVEIAANVIMSIPEINNNMEISLKMELDGYWEYNKKNRSLFIAIKDGDVYDFDIDFEYDNEDARAMLEQIGVKESLKQQIKSSVLDAVFHSCKRYIVYDLDEDGFTAMTTEGKKETMRLNKVD